MCACMEVIVKNSGVTIREVIGGVLGNRFRLCTIQSPTRSVSDLGALVEAIFPVLLIPIAANISFMALRNLALRNLYCVELSSNAALLMLSPSVVLRE